MIYLARGLKSYKKHTWYANDLVVYFLWNYSIRINFPSFSSTFYSLLPLLTAVLLAVLRIWTLSWGSKLLWLPNYHHAWENGGEREKMWVAPEVNANNHLLFLRLSLMQLFQINKILVFLFCPTLPHSATACWEQNALLNIFHDNPLWDNFF